MIVLSAQKVLQLHRFLMQETGGLDGLRDEGLFDSAVQGPFATFGGQELYPSIEEKAVKLGVTLTKNHAFLDGNQAYRRLCAAYLPGRKRSGDGILRR